MTSFEGGIRSQATDFTLEPAYQWRVDAACRNSKPEYFELTQLGYHATGREIRSVLNRNRINFKRALEVCAVCPVKQQCLDDASEVDRAVTVRGGQRPLLFSDKPRGRPKKGKESVCENGHKGPWSSAELGKKCKQCGARPRLAPGSVDTSRLLSEDEVAREKIMRHDYTHPDHEAVWMRSSRGSAECRTCKGGKVPPAVQLTQVQSLEIHHIAKHPDHDPVWASLGRGRLRCRVCYNDRRRVARAAGRV